MNHLSKYHSYQNTVITSWTTDQLGSCVSTVRAGVMWVAVLSFCPWGGPARHSDDPSAKVLVHLIADI